MFTKKEWKARIVEHPARRILQNVDTGEETTVDVSRDEGAVTQDGDAFSSSNMNDLEERIEQAFEDADPGLPEPTADDAGKVLQVDSSGAYALGSVAASSITAGTLGGKVVANADAAADISTVQVRNSVGTTTDPGAGVDVSSLYPDGTVIHVYE